MLVHFIAPLWFNSHINLRHRNILFWGIIKHYNKHSHWKQPIVSSLNTVCYTNQLMSFISRNVWINSSLGNAAHEIICCRTNKLWLLKVGVWEILQGSYFSKSQSFILDRIRDHLLIMSKCVLYMFTILKKAELRLTQTALKTMNYNQSLNLLLFFGHLYNAATNCSSSLQTVWISSHKQ